MLMGLGAVSSEGRAGRGCGMGTALGAPLSTSSAQHTHLSGVLQTLTATPSSIVTHGVKSQEWDMYCGQSCKYSTLGYMYAILGYFERANNG